MCSSPEPRESLPAWHASCECIAVGPVARALELASLQGLVPVTVEKTRYGFMVDGVICKYAEVRFNGALLESACCESEDYTAVARAVEVLGATHRSNRTPIRSSGAA